MSLFLQKKAQLEFFFRGGEVTLALGWDSYKLSWILNLLRDWVFADPSRCEMGPKPESAFSAVTQHLGNKQREKKQCPKPQSPLKMESLADGSAPVHKIQEEIRGVIRCWSSGRVSIQTHRPLLAGPEWSQGSSLERGDFNLLGLRFW